MRSEIEDIKELLDKKQKQLNNKEQRLKLIEMDLQSREKNIIQTAELKISENLAEKLKKFENDSKIILKRMKGMHDNLRQKTNSFKDLKESYIKNWTKDATSTLKQRNVTLEKMNEIHKQRIKSLEQKENESKTENEKLKAKIADMNSTLSILKNQLKTYDNIKSDKDDGSNNLSKENSNKEKEAVAKIEQKSIKATSKLRITENAHKIFEKRLCQLNEFTITQISKHLGLLADKIQIGECI